jgi:hypothetical protein
VIVIENADGVGASSAVAAMLLSTTVVWVPRGSGSVLDAAITHDSEPRHRGFAIVIDAWSGGSGVRVAPSTCTLVYFTSTGFRDGVTGGAV